MSAYVHMRLVDACLRLVRVWCNPKAVRVLLVLLVLLVESIRLHMAVPCCTNMSDVDCDTLCCARGTTTGRCRN